MDAREKFEYLKTEPESDGRKWRKEAPPHFFNESVDEHVESKWRKYTET